LKWDKTVRYYFAVIKKFYLKFVEGFLVRISFKPNSMKIISSKIMAYANANRALLIAMEVAVKPYTQQPTTMPDTVSLVSSSNFSSIDAGASTRLLCEGGRFVPWSWTGGRNAPACPPT